MLANFQSQGAHPRPGLGVFATIPLVTMKSLNPPLLEFKNLTVELGSNYALKNLSLRIRRGENVAIVGPNGSGKSTLIKTITREIYPEADTFKIFGEENWNIFELKDKLGIVSPHLQETFHRNLTGAEAILSGFFSAIETCWQDTVTATMKNRVKKILRFLGIERLEHRRMNEMSSGEARRILIGRALVHNPEALILDEPATSLDPAARQQFQTDLRKIAASGKNVILVTHDLHDIIPEIKRVILMKKGRVFKDGPKDAVLTEGNLQKLFETPVHIHKTGEYYYLWS